MSTKSNFLPPLSNKLCHDDKQDEAQSCLNIKGLGQSKEIMAHVDTTGLTIDSPEYLYNLCSEKKWDNASEHLKRLDLSDSLKEKQIRWKDKDGSNALHTACFNKPPLELVQSMIAIGGNEIVLIKDNFNVTALHEACVIEVAVDVVKLLIEAGGKELVVQKSTKGKFRTNDYGQSATIEINSTALHVVCENKEIEFDSIRDMVKVGKKDLVLVQKYDMETVLHQLCFKPSTPFDIVKLLIDVGEKELLMKRNQDNAIAFHIALERAGVHEPEVLKVFVDAGVNEMLNAEDKYGENSLPLNTVKYLEEKELRNEKEWKAFFSYFYKTMATLQNDKIRMLEAEITNLRQQQDETNMKQAKEIKVKNRMIEKLENASNNGTDEGSAKKPRLFPSWFSPSCKH